MTAKTRLAAAAGEQGLRDRALDTLRTFALESILASDEPLRTADLAVHVGRRLEMNLTEDEQGGLASVVRLVLDSDPLFSQANRQWDLALRLGRAEGDRRRPVEKSVEDFIDLIGHPVHSEPVSILVAAVYGRTPDYYAQMIERISPDSKTIFMSADGTVGNRRWLLDTTGEEEDYVLEDNRLTADDIAPLKAVAAKIKAKDPATLAKEIIAASPVPVWNPALQYLVWLRFPSMDGTQLFDDLLADPQLYLERGPAWSTIAIRDAVNNTILSLIRSPEAAAEVVASAVPTDADEMGGIASTTIRVSDEDLDQVFDYMVQDDSRSYRVQELCQQALEAFPGSRTYPAVHASLTSRLKEDTRFQWLGAERFRVAGHVPAEVHVLPEGLNFDDTEYETPEGESDRLVDSREWKYALDEQIREPAVQDVGDDCTTTVVAPVAKLVCSVPLHHYVAGTCYVRNADRSFFASTPDILHLTVLPNSGPKFDVWFNHRLGLLMGLKEWYDSNLPWVGGRFTLSRGEQSDEIRLEYADGREPDMDIPIERLQQLLALRGQAASDLMLLSSIVEQLLRAHPDGMSFVRLFTELNMVRRTRRAELASALSAQRYFTQNPQNAGTWTFDEKRKEKTRTKKKAGPKRPMRGMVDDEDEEFEFE